ncbi:sensor histidine kinase [Maribacter sp. IgM3_T14_3]|uniref:sensor histidine kinase n=1 Tax=Maribacter sp. IgM3_T14_3 TaxID=3415140 RepID=UPI003C6FBB2A
MKKEGLYHIIFWLAYLLLWSAQDVIYFNDFGAVLKLNTFTLLPLLAIVYLNLYFIVPRFLFKKKYTLYILFLCLFIITITALSVANHYAYFNFIVNNPRIGDFFISTEGYLAILTKILVLVGFSMSIFLLKERYFREKILEDISKKQLEVELQLLKEQINPHFLFNSLNSIYMMLEKDAEMGKEMLLRFSDILSYQLHETTESRIPLEKELENIGNYIGIESIRHGSLATINVDCIDYSGNLVISPMLLLPIIENAFKHSPSSSPYLISIFIRLNKENLLTLKVENSIGSKLGKKTSGIGLANVMRRLELVYPEKHELIITPSDEKFMVKMKIWLDD